MTDGPETLADRILAQARRQLPPTELERARVLDAMLGTIAGLAPDSSTPSGPARDVTPAWRWGRRLSSVIALMLAGGASYYAGLCRGRSEPRAAGPAPNALAVNVVVPVSREQERGLVVEQALPAPMLPQPRAKFVGHDARPVASSASSADGARASGAGLEEELRLVARAERAQRDGNSRLALALLGKLDEEIPAGQLVEERAAAGALARCALGYGSPAALLADFTRRFPTSLHLARVTATCGSNADQSQQDSAQRIEGRRDTDTGEREIEQ